MTTGKAIPQRYSWWRHHNGTPYQVLSVGNIDSERPEYPPTVTYQGVNQKIWDKTLENWYAKMSPVEDGFELPTPPDYRRTRDTLLIKHVVGKQANEWVIADFNSYTNVYMIGLGTSFVVDIRHKDVINWKLV